MARSDSDHRDHQKYLTGHDHDGTVAGVTTPARTWQCLGVPIDCVAQPGGTELAPDSLRHAGVGDGPPLIDLGDTRSRLRDPFTLSWFTGADDADDAKEAAPYEVIVTTTMEGEPAASSSC